MSLHGPMTSNAYSVHNPFQCNPSLHELLLLVFNLSDPPEYIGTPPVQLTQLMVGAAFTLNCTPSAVDPPVDTVSIEINGSPVTSGDTITVTDNVLTIPSVQRSHSELLLQCNQHSWECCHLPVPLGSRCVL